jgi:hypothetical protein
MHLFMAASAEGDQVRFGVIAAMAAKTGKSANIECERVFGSPTIEIGSGQIISRQ